MLLKTYIGVFMLFLLVIVLPAVLKDDDKLKHLQIQYENTMYGCEYNEGNTVATCFKQEQHWWGNKVTPYFTVSNDGLELVK
jgi:hypothetical protein